MLVQFSVQQSVMMAPPAAAAAADLGFLELGTGAELSITGHYNIAYKKLAKVNPWCCEL